MMTRHRRDEATAYTPDAQTTPSRWPQWLTRDVSAKDVVLFLIAALMALGFTNPIRRISALEARAAKVETQLEFISYLQCVQIRRSDPAGVPPGCAPIIDARTPK